jgi:RNA polymerase sigma-70 factor (ECF subfamily)
MDEREQLLDELRPVSFAIAYRMLGAVSDAEDIVQEALLRVDRTLEAGEEISSPRAYVGTVTSRLAIDELRSARARRETYTGEWLPEPLLTDPAEEPAGRAEMADSLSIAFLHLLESLTPEQRAALLLHDVFAYGYDEIAELVETSEENARQLASRARRQVAAGRPRFEADREQAEELARRFFAATQEGELDELEQMLSEDVVLHGDGGGKAPALARSLHGRDRVAKTLRVWARTMGRLEGMRIRPVELNRQPGALFETGDGELFAAWVLDIAEGRIQGVSGIVNPDKLARLGPVADTQALLAELRSRDRGR